ncbi:unnamed protein product [Lymnaea stagnalis]|uniref:Replication stress response regulator SDE2 n=1 Tax=Lymnaea stagnalis TaxID=6523 RepID=A0AAV2HFL6_LYMST
MHVDIIFCSRKYPVVNRKAKYVVDLLSAVVNSQDQTFLHSLTITEEIKSSFYVLCNGRKVSYGTSLEDGRTYHIVPRLLGGKGGFGSMLRAIGAQIEKTTSREACRDLSGRRMRDINNEKKLKEWLAKEAERERDRETRKQERLAKQLAPTQHKFDDPEYHEQRTKVQEDLEDALSKGLKRKQEKTNDSGPSSSKKSKQIGSSSKTEWLGADLDSDDLDSNPDDEANPGDLSSWTESSENPGYIVKNTEADDSQSSSSVKQELISVVSDDQTVQSSRHSDEEISCKTELNETCELSSTKSTNSGSSPINLDDFKSSQELAQLGLEVLKNALMVRGLKCGGTLQERAERLFLVKGLTIDQIDPSLFAKSKGKGKKSK